MVCPWCHSSIWCNAWNKIHVKILTKHISYILQHIIDVLLSTHSEYQWLSLSGDYLFSTLKTSQSFSSSNLRHLWYSSDSDFCSYILYFLFDIKILNIAPYVLRRGMYAYVRRWAIYVRPRGVWLSTGIDVRLRRASKVYVTGSVSIPRIYMRIGDVRFWYSAWWSMIAISWGRNGAILKVTELSLLSNKL